jgi:nucleoside-diphosphate-sugar epimerase
MILVTGGTGLVGSHLLYRLVLKNTSVKAIYRNKNTLQTVKNIFSYYSSNFEALFAKIIWIEADITDVFSLNKAFEDVTQVYHSAALISFDFRDYKAMRKINIEGTANIVNCCIAHKVKKLCYVSSIATLEKPKKTQIIDEGFEWSTESNNYGYAITKFGAEMEVWRASQENVEVVIVNPGVILGPGLWHNGTGALFSKIYNGLKFYSEGITGFVSVDDVVKAMILLMNSKIKNQRYILVAENLSFKTVFDEIAKTLNVKKPSIKVTRFMSELGWRIEYIKSVLTGKPAILTKHSAKSIHNSYFYSSKKIETDLNFNFEPVFNAIARISSIYKEDK